MQKSTGDTVVNAELHLLERLLGGINKHGPGGKLKICWDVHDDLFALPGEGDAFHLRLFSDSDGEDEEALSKKFVH